MLNLKQILETLKVSTNVDIYLHKPIFKDAIEQLPPKVSILRELGMIVDERHIHNEVVDAGEIWLAESLARRYAVDDTVIGTPLSNGVQVASIGDGLQNGTATAVTQNDVTLESLVDTDSGGANFVVSMSGGATANEFTVTVIFLTTEANGHTGGLVEAGIFAADPMSVTCTTETQKTNRMLNRTIFAPINKNSSFQMTIEWTVKMGSLTA